MIKLVCLSDLHLGEGESMIHHLFPEAVDRVVRRVREMAGRTNEVDHFVLLGDTLDYSEATVAQAKEEFAAFKEALTSGLGARVKQFHLVIGNHDHRLLDLVCGGDTKALLAHLSADSNEHGTAAIPLDGPEFDRAEIKALFGSDAVSLHYPNFEYHDASTKRLYLFTHGDLFGESVLKLGRVRHPLEPPSKADSVAELVRRSWDVIKLIWWETRFEAREEMYELLRSNEHHIFQAKGEKRLKRYLLDVSHYRKRWEKLENPQLHFVFGHTHDAFHRFFETSPVDGVGPVRVYNTGGWLVTGHDFHPHTSMFVIDSRGNRYHENLFFDIPYERDRWNATWENRH